MRHISSTTFKRLAAQGDVTDVVVRKSFSTAFEQLPDRCIKFTISSDTVDRAMDRVNQNGWVLDDYRRNPIVLWDHDTGIPPIGKCVSIGVEEGRLKAVVQFMPASIPEFGAKAEAFYQMCLTGYLNATSVGFKPREFALSRDPERRQGDSEPGADFESMELVEFSLVTVPSNPDALIEPMPVTQSEPHRNAEQQESKSDTPLNSSKKLSRSKAAMQAYALSL